MRLVVILPTREVTCWSTKKNFDRQTHTHHRHEIEMLRKLKGAKGISSEVKKLFQEETFINPRECSRQNGGRLNGRKWANCLIEWLTRNYLHKTKLDKASSHEASDVQNEKAVLPMRKKAPFNNPIFIEFVRGKSDFARQLISILIQLAFQGEPAPEEELKSVLLSCRRKTECKIVTNRDWTPSFHMERSTSAKTSATEYYTEWSVCSLSFKMVFAPMLEWSKTLQLWSYFWRIGWFIKRLRFIKEMMIGIKH